MHAIYLDNNATTAVSTAVRLGIDRYYDELAGNPSSPHSPGNRARMLLEQAREEVGALIGVGAEHMVFTSGGTEGNNAVIRGARALGLRRLVGTAVEHPSVLRPLEAMVDEGLELVLLEVDAEGLVSPERLGEALLPGPALVCIQWVNSETGVVQDIAALGAICREASSMLLVDAAQAVGRMRIELSRLPVDFLTFSGHKLHAPHGIGALFVRSPRLFPSWLWGGEQEAGLRAGTQNVEGAIGLGIAARERREGLDAAITQLSRTRDLLEGECLERIPQTRVNGSRRSRVCNTCNLHFAGVDGQAVLAQLDALGVYVSQSSACSSHRVEPSYVLCAMGLSESEAFASIRFSTSVYTNDAHIADAVEALAQVIARLRAFTWL
ncbi:MAG: cysteine desulfurase family protein [Myxococcota bacterium]|jgi:cysteine desulfurase|nr:cysteine desulfurase family protein [Myxococcota bacterium]